MLTLAAAALPPLPIALWLVLGWLFVAVIAGLAAGAAIREVSR